MSEVGQSSRGVRASGLLALALLTASGCFLDRAGRGGPPDAGPARDAGPDGAIADAGAADAGAPDAGLLEDAGSDAGPPPVDDAGPPDAGPPDSGPPDAGPPDSGPPDAGPPDAGPPSCASQYGSALDYVLCDERATECEFATTLATVRSCRTTCEGLGGRCLEAWRNETDTPICQRRDTTTCDGFQVDNICICSRGP